MCAGNLVLDSADNPCLHLPLPIFLAASLLGLIQDAKADDNILTSVRSGGQQQLRKENLR